jgi:hypothetical protein
MTEQEDGPEAPRFSVKIGRVKGSHFTIAENVYMDSPKPEEPAKPPPALRVLLLGSSPFDVGLGRIRADREFRAIRDAAGEALLHLGAYPAASAADLKAAIDRPHPDVLHLCCHGDSTTMLFETPDGAPHRVPVDSIVARLARYRDEAGLRLRCIVLAMCHSAEAAPRFAAFADSVVGWKGEIDDRCAVRFAAEFYRVVARRTADTFGGSARLAAAEVRADDSLPCSDIQERLFVIGQ